jgi:hypothetical protein
VAAQNHITREAYFHPSDPAGWLKPGEPFIVDGLDWSWAFVIYEVVPGYPAYCIGTNGLVWSRSGNQYQPLLDRWVIYKGDRYKTGHTRVVLGYGLSKWRIFIHDLALIVFVGLRPDGMGCRHLNGNPRDNRITNLRWGTPKENADDRTIHGTHPVGSRSANSKMTECDVEEIYRRIEAGDTYQSIGESLGVDGSRITHIVRGDEWRHATLGRDPLPNMLIGSNNRNAKLTEADVVEIRRLAKGGMMQREIGLIYGINKATVSRIVNRKWWTHVAE